MNGSEEKKISESSYFRGKIEQALEENDIETICDIAIEDLIKKTTREDFLEIMNHKVNIFEKIFIGMLTLRDIDFLIYTIHEIFDQYKELSLKIPSRKVMDAYFEIKSKYSNEERFKSWFHLWFFDTIIEKYKESFSPSLKDIVYNIVIQREKEKLIDFIEDDFIYYITKEDFREILQDPELDYLGFLISILKDFDESWYWEEYSIVSPKIFSNPPQAAQNRIADFMESADVKIFIVLINSDLYRLVNPKRLFTSKKLNIFVFISNFLKDEQLYIEIFEQRQDWVAKLFNISKKKAPSEFIQRFTEFIDKCSTDDLLRIIVESAPIPIYGEEWLDVIGSSETNHLEKIFSPIPLIEGYCDRPLEKANHILQWYYEGFDFLKHNQVLNDIVLHLAYEFLFEIIHIRWLEYLTDQNFITLFTSHEKKICDTLKNIIVKAYTDSDKAMISRLTPILSRFLTLNKNEFSSFTATLPADVYAFLLEMFQFFLLESTKQYTTDLIIDKEIKQSCANLLKRLKNYNILDEYSFVTYKGEFFLVINNTLRIQKRNIEDISDIKGLSDLKNLEILDLSKNKITDIKGLEPLRSLRVLNLRENKIESLSGLEHLFSLEIIDFSYNKKFCEVSELQRLKELTNLTKIIFKWTNLPYQFQGSENIERFFRNINNFMITEREKEAKRKYVEAKTLINEDKFIDAKNLLLKAVELRPKYYEAWEDLGFVFMELKEYTEAEKWLEKIIELDSETHFYATAYYMYARLKSLKNHHEKALQFLQKAIEKNSKYRESAEDDPDFNNIKNLPEFKNIIIGFNADKKETSLPLSEFCLSMNYSHEIYYIKKDVTSNTKDTIPKSRLEPPNQEQLHFILELEGTIGRKIPYVYDLSYDISGVKVKNGVVVGLALINCGISTLPDVLFNFEFLTDLIIGDKTLEVIPDSIRNLRNLETLSLCGHNSHSKLESIPNEISEIKTLKTLYLENNNLQQFPTSLINLKSLQKLSLWDNNIQELPESISELSNLKELLLGSNENMTSLPSSVKDLHLLEQLSLYETNMKEFPDNILKLKNLRKLDLSWNSLETLPSSMKDLIHLKELNLSHNAFSNFPEAITELNTLERVYLSNNPLTCIPDAIGNLVSLQVLNLDNDSQIARLPESIVHLKNLEFLGLNRCYDTIIPEALKNKEKLAIVGNSDIEYKEDGSFNLKGFSLSVSDYPPEDKRSCLRNPDEIVITDEKIIIDFDYPLSVVVGFKYYNKGGFSRMDLWRCICEGYKKIYDEEELDVGDPGTVPNMLNRARSFGRYGIWGHDIDDLSIERIYYSAKTKRVNLFIGS